MATAAKKTAPLKRSTKAAPAPKAAPRKTGTARKSAAVDIGVQAPLQLVRPQWTTACVDWQTRIVNAETMTPCAPLFPTAAAHGMRIFDALQMVSANMTFGETRPWVREFAASIFGAYCDVKGHPDEGRRLIRTFFMLISKKNGKSETAAGIMLTALILNWRKEAEYLILSPTKEVADNSWKPIRAAINADPTLSAMFTIRNAERTAIHNQTGATLKVVAADSQTVTGKKAAGVLVDELHEFGKIAKAEDMLVEATGGLMSRPEGFVIYLTTQSAEPPAGVFKKELTYARRVRDGAVNDPTYFPIIYEFPPQYLQRDTRLYLVRKNWYMVNPNLGASVDEEWLHAKITKAGETGEDSLQSIVSKHLNIQIGLDLGSDAWPGAQLWPEAANGTWKLGITRLEHLLSSCEVVTAGIDGGGLDDLLALTFTGRMTGTTDQYLSWSHCWVSDIVLKNRKEISERLLDFARDGSLTIIEVPGDDVKQLAQHVRDVYDRGLLEAVGIDPARIASLLTALEDLKLPVDDPEFIIKVRQGWSLYSAMLWMERALYEKRYFHSDQALVDWAVGNAKVIPRGNAMLVTKEISGKAKIDPVMSAFNAAELMSHNPASRTGGYSLAQLTLMG